MKLKIAVVQFEILQFNPVENIVKAKKYIEQASKQKSSVIVFPEDFITGPVCGKREFVDFDNRNRRSFQELASKHNIDIVTGSFIEGENNGWYNTSYYIDSGGNVKNRYRKVNLWGPERQYLTPGNQVKAFNTKYGKAAVLICWDLAFPEIFRKLVHQNVRIIYIPSFWCYGDAGKGTQFNKNSEIEFVNSACTTRAFENEIILIYCNAAGKFELPGFNFTDNLIGQSQICLPFYGAVNHLNHNGESMFIQEIDTEVLDDAEKAYSIRSDLKVRVLS
jgi:predicted amidohydrolase